MSDSAKGPLSGYLFQFEKALLLLSKLDDINDFVTIEEVDDVATHDATGMVMMTVQAKHSISPTGTTFGDTSYALWRTFEIWIKKMKEGVFDTSTEFICSTNKKISATSLIFKFQSLPWKQVLNLIKGLLKQQEQTLKALLAEDPKSGATVKQTIKFIKYALSNPIEFEILKNNIKITDEEKIKEKFLIKIHKMSDKITQIQQDNIYDAFYGWITYNSKAKWCNSKVASFSKKDFDNKMEMINSNPSIINAIFRTKQSLGSITDIQFNEKKKELFVRQIEDINRNQDAKSRKIKDAILDFIYSDIEISYIISIGDYTKKDFDDFLEECFEKWQICYDSHVVKEVREYNDEEKNALAIKIFDTIMNEIEMKFKEGFSFNTSNKYIKNGSFLRLSNLPSLGWHPEWKTKYIS